MRSQIARYDGHADWYDETFSARLNEEEESFLRECLGAGDIQRISEPVRTYQTRLQLQPQEAQALEAYGELFGRALRTMHARRRRKVADTKPAFMAEFGLTARQFNAARFTLEGMERSYRERLVQLVAEDRVRLVSLKRRRTKSEKPFARHHLARRIARIEHRIALREDAAARGSVRIAFGSRKLWRAQYALEANGYDSHGAWRTSSSSWVRKTRRPGAKVAS